jgi:hypothetical protein
MKDNLDPSTTRVHTVNSGNMPGPFDGPVTGTPRYPVIDTDPHAFRVVRYFRPTDYATWATVTAAFPASMYLWGMFLILSSQPAMNNP